MWTPLVIILVKYDFQTFGLSDKVKKLTNSAGICYLKFLVNTKLSRPKPFRHNFHEALKSHTETLEISKQEFFDGTFNSVGTTHIYVLLEYIAGTRLDCLSLPI